RSLSGSAPAEEVFDIMLVFKRADNPRQQREVNHESLACCNRRYVDLIGALLVSAGFFLASMTTSLIFLYTVFGLIVGAGNGFGYATLYGTRNLGMNYGLLFTAWGAAGIIGPMFGTCLRRVWRPSICLLCR